MTCPQDWDRDTALAVTAAITRVNVGEWSSPSYRHPANVVKKMGRLLSASSRDKMIAALRCFFQDGQEWEWFPRRWNPAQVLVSPFSVVARSNTLPRTIASDVWAKLLFAGLNLDLDDLPASGLSTPQKREVHYPLEMVQAISIVWLFSGLRCDEIRRLRVGCIRWQEEEVRTVDNDAKPSESAVCWLDVPVNKTSAAFTKPVDRLVGEAITQWEQQRPGQPVWHDRKTGELVRLLFSWRGKMLGQSYINHSLIPMLCQKAGVPKQDARGSITSHRARSTIATQLFNAKEPLSLFDLQQWLGHRFITSTQRYARLSPAKVSRSYQKAGYFERNVRTIEVLLDQQAIRQGATVQGEPWKYYDLGHGYCTYDFFDQCPHRMACAKCSFYRPKAATHALWQEGKIQLERMLQKIPLQEEERAAVEEGIEALKKLHDQLADVPTPDGRTPNQLKKSQSIILS